MALIETNLENFLLMKRGKIRDVYKLNDSRVLIITTDRVSAFDEVMSNPIADKGKILNSLTLFWMQLFEGIVDNHLTGQSISEFLNKDEADFFEDRAVVAELLEPLALESVVRGFLEGSAWEDYEKSGFVCGFKLPVGLRKGAKLPEPIFTPALKVNERGGHDRNLSYQECCEIFGAEKTEIVKTKSIELFNKAALFLKEKNIVKHFPSEGEGTLSGIIVQADEKTGLAQKVKRLIIGGSLNK